LEKISSLYEQIDDAKIQFDSVVFLQQQEEIGASHRIQQWQELLERETQISSYLQQRYKQLQGQIMKSQVS
jgi:hypothetical protein